MSVVGKYGFPVRFVSKWLSFSVSEQVALISSNVRFAFAPLIIDSYPSMHQWMGKLSALHSYFIPLRIRKRKRLCTCMT